MKLKDYHWDKFYLHMYYHANIDDVFNMWVTSKGQSGFFVRECLVKRNDQTLDKDSIFQADDTYEYLWEDGAKSSGKVISVDEGKHEFVFSFARAKVRVRLKNTELGVLLELKHFDIPEEDQYAHQLDCRPGWTHFLVNLKAVIEKAVDLRESDPRCGGTLGWGIYPPDNLVLD